MPINYERAKLMGPRLKAALTRASNIPTPEARYTAVLAACKAAVREWEEWGAWPDQHSRWQRALDDAAMKLQQSGKSIVDIGLPRLEDL